PPLRARETGQPGAGRVDRDRHADLKPARAAHRLAGPPSPTGARGATAPPKPPGRTLDLHAPRRRTRALLQVRREGRHLRTLDRRRVTEGIVAPTGFEPVFQSRPRFRPFF